jgi:hypothetical protein
MGMVVKLFPVSENKYVDYLNLYQIIGKIPPFLRGRLLAADRNNSREVGMVPFFDYNTRSYHY